METPHRRKVTAKVDSDSSGMFGESSRNGNPLNRPVSPAKLRMAPSRASAPLPSVRPKAKLSSSADVRKTTGATSVCSTTTRSVGSSTPRSTSPLKPIETRNGRASPLSQVSRARVTVRPTSKPSSTVSVPSSPRVGQTPSPFLTPAPSDPSLNTIIPRKRQSSISSTSQLSSASSLHITPPRTVPPFVSAISSLTDTDASGDVPSPAVRITSKVSATAKAKPGAATTLQPSLSVSPPNTAASSSHQRRISRTPSVSSLPSENTPTFYPITTASPVANPHRFATARIPSAKNRPYQPFPTTDDLTISVHTKNAQPVIGPASGLDPDPALIPLPPQSPPTSTLSFSSHSSTSRSSLSNVSHSTAPTPNSRVNTSRDNDVDGDIHSASARNSLDGGGRSRASSFILRDPASRGLTNGAYTGDVDEVRKVKAEAKSNRKIADLEITNRSLLAINATLEATKHRQAKEIRDLRRKLRESRLILPPRTYRSVKSASSDDEVEEDDEEEADEGDEDVGGARGKEDQIFQRVKGILDTLLENGRLALEARTEDFPETKCGTRVLHEVEARSWRDRSSGEGLTRRDAEYASANFEDVNDESFMTAELDEMEVHPRPESPSRVAIPDDDSNLGSEDEVEALMEEIDVPPPAPPLS